MRRPSKGHVLDEVRQAALVLVFEGRPGVDGEPDVRALFRPRVAADVIGQAVLELAGANCRVDRKLRTFGDRYRRVRGAQRRAESDRNDGESEKRVAEMPDLASPISKG
jgi:hypothetical protein